MDHILYDVELNYTSALWWYFHSPAPTVICFTASALMVTFKCSDWFHPPQHCCRLGEFIPKTNRKHWRFTQKPVFFCCFFFPLFFPDAVTQWNWALLFLMAKKRPPFLQSRAIFSTHVIIIIIIIWPDVESMHWSLSVLILLCEVAAAPAAAATSQLWPF